MRLLQRKFEVETRYGGGFVQEIDGVGGGRQQRPAGRLVLLRQRDRGEHGRRRRASSRPATASGGTTTTGAPRCASRPSSAPSPSRSCPAAKGKKIPVRIDCARRRGSARAARCGSGSRTPARRSAGPATIGTRGGPRGAARAGRALGRGPRATRPRARIEQGPKVSGVFARPSPGRHAIELLDARGRDRADARRRAPAWWRRRASSTSSRPGSSRAPTPSASPRRRPR